MPSEADRWKNGDLRNTAGHTEGATGAVTGGVEGHVKSKPWADQKNQSEGKMSEAPAPRKGPAPGG